MSVKVIVQRSVSDDETVRFEGDFESPVEALEVAAGQLALCRQHMARYNEEVRLLDERKSAELTEQIAARGEELKALDAKIALARTQLEKADKRLKAAG